MHTFSSLATHCIAYLIDKNVKGTNILVVAVFHTLVTKDAVGRPLQATLSRRAVEMLQP